MLQLHTENLTQFVLWYPFVAVEKKCVFYSDLGKQVFQTIQETEKIQGCTKNVHTVFFS